VSTHGSPFAVVAANLRIDALTAEVVTALRGVGVRALLLKGPSIARWLYNVGERAYVDCDLLVAPRDRASAERVLGRLGFRPAPWRAWLRAAREWQRGDSTVDLHTALFGVGVPSDRAWAVLSRETETMAVGGVDVEVLALPARTLQLATHVAQHPVSHGQSQSREDLRRAIQRVSPTTWRRAGRLAFELRAPAALAAGLRQVEEGARVAQELGVDHASSRLVELVSGDGPPIALALAQIAAAESTRLRLALLARAIVPQGTTAKAYVTRLRALAGHAPADLAAWRRARR
jgi:hypothetical protein